VKRPTLKIEPLNPQTVLSFNTDRLEEISVIFNEEVDNVMASDLIVNEYSATSFEG
jgi:hypothetical protein